MADREKVIKAYEDFVNGYECFCTSDDYEYEMHKEVLALLKEQEPVKPTFKQDESGINCWCCGSCGAYMYHIYDGIDKAKEYSKYCRQCGKQVKWE